MCPQKERYVRALWRLETDSKLKKRAAESFLWTNHNVVVSQKLLVERVTLFYQEGIKISMGNYYAHKVSLACLVSLLLDMYAYYTHVRLRKRAKNQFQFHAYVISETLLTTDRGKKCQIISR